jgi:hypothetical protein
VDNLVLEGIINNLYDKMASENIKIIHVTTMVLGLKRESIPAELMDQIKNSALTLSISPNAIGGIAYNDNGTFTVKCAAKGKRVEVTLISSLLANITLYHSDDTTKMKPFQPVLWNHPEDGLFDQTSLDSKYKEFMEDENPLVNEKRSKMRVLS